MNDRDQAGQDQLLLLLAVNLQQGALVQLGKIADPGSGRVGVDLAAARLSIDLLDMLRTKCRSSTGEAVMRELDRMVMDLQLNFADTARRQAAGNGAESAAPAAAGEAEGGTADSTGDASPAAPEPDRGDRPRETAGASDDGGTAGAAGGSRA